MKLNKSDVLAQYETMFLKRTTVEKFPVGNYGGFTSQGIETGQNSKK